MRGHLETSLGGLHLGLITFLFIVFLLWRQSHLLTLGNNNRSMHTIPAQRPNYPHKDPHTARLGHPQTYTLSPLFLSDAR